MRTGNYKGLPIGALVSQTCVLHSAVLFPFGSAILESLEHVGMIIRHIVCRKKINEKGYHYLI